MKGYFQMTEFDYLFRAKARILEVSVEEVMFTVARKALMEEDAVDDPIQLIKGISLSDIH